MTSKRVGTASESESLAKWSTGKGGQITSSPIQTRSCPRWLLVLVLVTALVVFLLELCL